MATNLRWANRNAAIIGSVATTLAAIEARYPVRLRRWNVAMPRYNVNGVGDYGSPMTHAAPAGCPTSDIDLWSDEVLRDPLPAFRELRDLGSVVWLDRYGIAALPRFAETRTALTDWQTFSSASGVSASDAVNAARQTNILESDPPHHDQERKTMAAQLSVGCLAPERAGVEQTAQKLVDRALSASTFDGVHDLARPYSLAVVSDLLGLPDDRRDELPDLAERAFNLMGPTNTRALDGVQAVMALGAHAASVSASGCLRPGGKAAELVALGQASRITAYTWPGIDTTVNGLANALYLFATNPEQWDRLRANPSLSASAFAEALRMYAPVKHFTRLTTQPTIIGNVELPADTRVLMMFGSANRDERRYPNPDTFDIARDPVDQLAFGRGIHLCVGIHLARMEAAALLSELIARVERFELAGEPEWLINNTLLGLAHLPLRAVRAGRSDRDVDAQFA
jgi:cytochrome P450